MNIKCPHCGTEYEVEKKDMYRYTKCEVCGKGFVTGATSSLLSSGTPSESNAYMPPSRRLSVQRRTAAQPRHLARGDETDVAADLDTELDRQPFSQAQKEADSSAGKISNGKHFVVYAVLGVVILLLVGALACVLVYGGKEKRRDLLPWFGNWIRGRWGRNHIWHGQVGVVQFC